MRLVVQALSDFRATAADLFELETDKPADKGEDATREALDSISVSKVPVRLYGRIDYKRARYVFHPDYALRQALFVDSKAEKSASDLRLQIAQTSMRIWHDRTDGRGTIDEQGSLPRVLSAGGYDLLTTTIFVKYVYRDLDPVQSRHKLLQIKVAALPNGFLQSRYNPSPQIHIWKVGPNSPQREEDFRTRMSFPRLAARCPWRQQIIPMAPALFVWEDRGYITPPSQPEEIVEEEAALDEVDANSD